MPRLSDTQARFVEALRHSDRETPEVLAKPGNKTPKRRFDIYRNNVVVGMIEGLRATFPAIERLVGEAFFKAVARAYLAEEPPTSPLLFLYGKTFAGFLEKFPPAVKLPYLGDVARLEWARLEAYHAADQAPISIEALGVIPPDEVAKVTFSLHPSVALIRSTWPVVSLWAASTDRGSSDDVDMSKAECAVIIRPTLEIDTRLLAAGGFYFLTALKEGRSLEAAASQAASSVGDFDLAVHLQGLFEIGAVTALANNHQGVKG